MRILPIEVAAGDMVTFTVPDWMVVVMGLVTVFIGLICLIAICKIMGTMVALANKASAPAAAPAPAAQPAPQAAPAAPEVMPQQTVAAIAVAIAENMGTDVSKIRILSIKKI